MTVADSACKKGNNWQNATRLIASPDHRCIAYAYYRPLKVESQDRLAKYQNKRHSNYQYAIKHEPQHPSGVLS